MDVTLTQGDCSVRVSVAGYEGSKELTKALQEGMAAAMFLLSFGVSWLVLGAAALQAMQRNPADEAVDDPKALGRPIQGKPFCSICQVTVRLDSKHCWECNKCVANFDHHCPWLNNCIGALNYASFFVSVWSLLAMLTALLAGCVAPLVELGSSSRGLDFWLLVGILVVYSPLLCLDISLVGFHVFLCCKGITTYEHLTGKTRRPASVATPRSKPGAVPSIGDRTISARSNRSARSFASNATSAVVEHLHREVSDFVFGSSMPADPSDGLEVGRRLATKTPSNLDEEASAGGSVAAAGAAATCEAPSGAAATCDAPGEARKTPWEVPGAT